MFGFYFSFDLYGIAVLSYILYGHVCLELKKKNSYAESVLQKSHILLMSIQLCCLSLQYVFGAKVYSLKCYSTLLKLFYFSIINVDQI